MRDEERGKIGQMREMREMGKMGAVVGGGKKQRLKTKNQLRTPNSELRTPNSELRTPNSELRTLSTRFNLSGDSQSRITDPRRTFSWVGGVAD